MLCRTNFSMCAWGFCSAGMQDVVWWGNSGRALQARQDAARKLLQHRLLTFLVVFFKKKERARHILLQKHCCIMAYSHYSKHLMLLQ
eukprot:SAG31_NODE_476_length_15154_cov_24.796878_6_plen_87_part_00